METGNAKLCETESGYSFEPVQKDNRSRYLKEETNCFQETNLNSEFYQQYLKENQIERYELEACGHEIVIPKGNIACICRFSDQYSTVLYTVCEVRMWRPWQTEICRTVPRILQGIGIFISQASGDVWKV